MLNVLVIGICLQKSLSTTDLNYYIIKQNDMNWEGGATVHSISHTPLNMECMERWVFQQGLLWTVRWLTEWTCISVQRGWLALQIHHALAECLEYIPTPFWASNPYLQGARNCSHSQAVHNFKWYFVHKCLILHEAQRLLTHCWLSWKEAVWYNDISKAARQIKVISFPQLHFLEQT